MRPDIHTENGCYTLERKEETSNGGHRADAGCDKGIVTVVARSDTRSVANTPGDLGWVVSGYFRLLSPGFGSGGDQKDVRCQPSCDGDGDHRHVNLPPLWRRDLRHLGRPRGTQTPSYGLNSDFFDLFGAERSGADFRMVFRFPPVVWLRNGRGVGCWHAAGYGKLAAEVARRGVRLFAKRLSRRLLPGDCCILLRVSYLGMACPVSARLLTRAAGAVYAHRSEGVTHL